MASARQRLENWAEGEGIELSYSAQYDHDEGIGWDISFYLEGRRREPSLNFNSHDRSLEAASAGMLLAMKEYGIEVPVKRH